MTNTDTLKQKYDELRERLSDPKLRTSLSLRQRELVSGELLAEFVDEVAAELGWQKPKRVLRVGSKIETPADLEALPDYSSLSCVIPVYGGRAKVLKCPDGNYRYAAGGVLTLDAVLKLRFPEVWRLPEGVTEVTVPQ